MKHLGDITKIHGDQIEPVDCITFGSPCQDLSIAGRRAGLQGERSGLFMEAVRIIKEMRGGTDGRYPTFAIWENVPGAFSSNKGEDFEPCWKNLPAWKNQTLQFLHLRGGGRWSKAGAIAGNGWSFLGDSSMLNIGECPNAERESLLSWILQVDVPEKYYLSAKACRGILIRASRRGQEATGFILGQALLDVIRGVNRTS